jgi:hypothetical protein
MRCLSARRLRPTMPYASQSAYALVNGSVCQGKVQHITVAIRLSVGCLAFFVRIYVLSLHFLTPATFTSHPTLNHQTPLHLIQNVDSTTSRRSRSANNTCNIHPQDFCHSPPRISSAGRFPATSPSWLRQFSFQSVSEQGLHHRRHRHSSHRRDMSQDDSDPSHRGGSTT